MGVKIESCDCKSEYQDRMYGKGKRVKNEGKDKVTCTVCGTKTSKEHG
jgi:hypothetical protein